MPEIRMGVEELAASAYRAFCYAGSIQEEPSWEHLGLDQQAQWMNLARQAEPIFLQMEGKSYKEVAAKIAALWAGVSGQAFYANLSKRMQLIWQAVVRHIMAILDSDDDQGPDLLERTWGEWVDAKLRGEP